MSVPHTEYCIFTERLGSFIFPLNFLNTKDPTPSGVATRPACLSVCGGNSSWHTEGNMRGRTEGGSQATHCPELRIQQDKIYGDTQWERNSPSKFKRLQMCAWPTATAHIWARKLPRTPPLPSSEPSMSHLYNAALCSTLEKQLGRTHGRCKLLLTRHPLHQLRWIHSGVCIIGGLKRPLSWRLGGEIWRRESLGDFRRERCSQ